MPFKSPVFRPVAQQSRAMQKRDYDRARRRDAPWRRWYSLRIWRDIRATQLTREPCCERHKARGEVMLATVVHHLVPHRGDWQRFITGPFESLCSACHDSEAQAEERAARAGREGP